MTVSVAKDVPSENSKPVGENPVGVAPCLILMAPVSIKSAPPLSSPIKYEVRDHTNGLVKILTIS